MGDSYSGISIDLCKNCNKREAWIGSSRWLHNYSCCSEACGIRLGEKIRNKMIFVPQKELSQPFSFFNHNEETSPLRIRIKVLENRIKELNRR